MHLVNNALKTPFAKKWAALIGFLTVVLLATNPEVLSLMLLVNLVGVDIFVLLLGIQVRQHWSVLSTFIPNPIYLRVKGFLSKL